MMLGQGLPTVLLGVMCFFYLPSRPDSTSFLNESERKIVLERMGRGTSGDSGAGVNKRERPVFFVVGSSLDVDGDS